MERVCLYCGVTISDPEERIAFVRDFLPTGRALFCFEHRDQVKKFVEDLEIDFEQDVHKQRVRLTKRIKKQFEKIKTAHNFPTLKEIKNGEHGRKSGTAKA